MDDIVFVGEWIKERLLGSGSFGIVVLWKHRDTGEKLAIKSCKWGDELTDKHKERWTKEVELLQNCSNNNIVATKELPPEFITNLAPANPSGLPMLCMEYCSGGDLRQMLNKFDSLSGLKEVDVRQILSDVRNAMEFLNNNKITHRDLKPENIVMQIRDSDNQVPNCHPNVIFKLIDLGFAKEIDSKSVCASFVGTLQYLAPELLYSKTYSNSVDFWSFGLVAFEIACGVRPFLPYLAPVQWMPYVKKKTSEQIRVFETHHGDVEYSNEIFPENHLSAPFKLLLEKWLQVALEWDPKRRGRDSIQVRFTTPDNKNTNTDNLIIFSLLKQILETKILKIFSVFDLTELAYEINDGVLISTVKTWIERDTKICKQDQILISQNNYFDISNNDFASAYCNEKCTSILYLYKKNYLIKENIQPKVPISVQRCLEQPKSLYNFKNSKDLYKCTFYLVSQEKNIFDAFITSLFVRAESIKVEGKKLLLKHNSVDKLIGKIATMEEVLHKVVKTGKTYVEEIKSQRSATNFLGGFNNIFIAFTDITERISKLQTAWNQLTNRLQSAARRSNELIPSELNTFISKNNFNKLYNDIGKAYIAFRKIEREYRLKEKSCNEAVKICYNCLKSRDKFIQDVHNQPYVIKLLDVSSEFEKMADIIKNASENAERLQRELEVLLDEVNNCIWSTMSVLSIGHNDLDSIPYTVVSFEKKDFNNGAGDSTNKLKQWRGSEELASLLEDSMKIRSDAAELNKKIIMQRKILNQNLIDFSYLQIED